MPEHSSSAPGEGPRPGRRAFAARGAIVLAVLLVYGGSFGVPFLFDDSSSIQRNETIRSLTTALRPPPGGHTVSGRPVVNLSLALSFALSGTSVWGYHALNVAIHALAALTVFGNSQSTVSPVLLINLPPCWATASLTRVW